MLQNLFSARKYKIRDALFAITLGVAAASFIVLSF